MADLVDADLLRDVVVERGRRVVALLDGVETTENERADEHLRVAENIARRIVEAADSEDGTLDG